ncbi:hypothetical protein C1H46_025356 [Malus baccata]|uniref:non-specific serine/threonine protein kinase n=1 Tax=Malus baccata TaxID=106549 RepID=A0A540LRM2_MALBA|nr:hypothetical protein C1H46_025356 [Malus baccata]
MKLKQLTAGAAALLLLFLLPAAVFSDAQQLQTSHNEFGLFNESYYSKFAVLHPATIGNYALQITPDSAGNFTLKNLSGRVFYNHSFTLWEDSGSNSSDPAANGSRVASFNSSFLFNVFRPNSSAIPGEGMAFLIAPDMTLPVGSHGQYLGLTNATTDGDPNNHLLAVELDTFKQSFDPDDNHMGININSIRSNKTVSLSDLDIQISPPDAQFYMVWIEYGGDSHQLDVYMAKQQDPRTKGFVTHARPTRPILTDKINLKDIVKQQSYFGFAASTGTAIELHCVLKWNLTVELLPGGKGGDSNTGLKIGLGVGVGVPAAALMLLGLGGLYKRRKAAASHENILGTLKSLPGTPREFSLKELKKATNNFDERHKLGQGGFGVVYRGVLPKENLEVAVKKFSRDNLQGKDNFLAELTIINRLRHKHLVRLLGWCHKNGMLLIVYEFMPNGSLDNHLFGETENATLGWSQRYKIVAGVASALHYLHNEYDQRVVHRDLKASNIMLDSNFNSRLGDFGLARALDNEKTSYAELEGVPGTMGYIAPECFHTGKATCESDIYGFGVVILEVVCGQRPWTKMGGFQFVVDWVWSLHREGRVLDAVDQRLGNDYVAGEAERLLLLGLACMHPIAGERPKTQTIIQIISGSVPVPRVPPFKPAFVWPSSNMPEGLLGPQQAAGNKLFNILSGTSMACPHVTGIAALIKAVYPSWSPAAIRSAIMTTATLLDKNYKPILVDPEGRRGNTFDYGLVYDAHSADYVEFLCSVGYDKKAVHQITRDNSTCKQAFRTASDLNYPSITVPYLVGNFSVTRTVTNVGRPKSIYRAAVSPPIGINVTIVPNRLIFNRFGQKIKFTVNFKVAAPPAKGYAFGFFSWVRGRSRVTSPLVVRVAHSNSGLLR